MDSGLFKVRLCTKDLSGFVGFVKTGRIFGIQVTNRIHESESLRFGLANPGICEVGFVNHKMNPWICEKRIHVFTNLLYNSCILNPLPKMFLRTLEIH
jgi:hypothetical protein